MRNAALQHEDVIERERQRVTEMILEEHEGSRLPNGLDRINHFDETGLAPSTRVNLGFDHDLTFTPGKDARGDLNRLIEDTATIARNEWKYVAELVLDLDAEMPFVSCHSSDLGQVVLNLIVNAAHAIAEKQSGHGQLGRIEVRTRYDANRSRVEIRVSDDGPGIPEHLRTRIFDPFFTTKPVGKGTGQGLAIATSVIADKHGGTLRLDETVSEGAAFVISMPA